MAKTSSGWVYDSLILNFMTQPFRWIWVLFLAILIVFGTSIISQTYFGTDNQLQNEIATLRSQTQQQGLLSDEPAQKPINVTVSRAAYSLLHGVFFDLSGITKAWQAEQEDDFGYTVKQKFLLPNFNLLTSLDRTLKIVSVRLGHLSYFVGLLGILCLVALIDGFVARAIRQQNVGRESAGIYHRAKYWRTGIMWISMIAYLASPFPISANWLFLPSVAYAGLVWLQAKYLKKYL